MPPRRGSVTCTVECVLMESSDKGVQGAKEERWRPACVRRRSEVGTEEGSERERRSVRVERVVDGGIESGVARG